MKHDPRRKDALEHRLEPVNTCILVQLQNACVDGQAYCDSVVRVCVCFVHESIRLANLS
jgi:hypothetical protein